jgi:hypothetical protein
VIQTFILAAALAVGFASLPFAWGLRAWVAVGLPMLWAQTLVPITPFQNQGPFDGFGSLLLSWLFLSATLGLAARAFWTLAQAPLDWASLSHGMRGPDGVLAVLYGLFMGVVLTLLLATELRGMSGGVALHFAIAGIAAVAALTALRLPFRLRCLTVAALATVACLTMVGGLSYPRLILSKAEFIRPENPRCLRTPDGSAPTLDQLRLLTLPEARSRRPNLVLTVMTENGPKDFRWSYRSFAFRTYDSYEGGPCPSP